MRCALFLWPLDPSSYSWLTEQRQHTHTQTAAQCIPSLSASASGEAGSAVTMGSQRTLKTYPCKISVANIRLHPSCIKGTHSTHSFPLSPPFPLYPTTAWVWSRSNISLRGANMHYVYFTKSCDLLWLIHLHHPLLPPSLSPHTIFYILPTTSFDLVGTFPKEEGGGHTHVHVLYGVMWLALTTPLPYSSLSLSPPFYIRTTSFDLMGTFPKENGGGPYIWT